MLTYNIIEVNKINGNINNINICEVDYLEKINTINEIVKVDECEPMNIKKEKKRAKCLKVYINSNGKKIWIPPIPLIIVSGLVKIGLKFVNKKSKNNIPIDKKDIGIILKELRKLPPFVIVEVEDKTTNSIVKIQTK